MTSPGDPRGVYLQQGPDVLTRMSLTGCVFHDSAPLVSQLQKRGCKVLTDHTRLRMRYSLYGFGRGIQHQPDRPGDSVSLDYSRRKKAFHCSVEVLVVPRSEDDRRIESEQDPTDGGSRVDVKSTGYGCLEPCSLTSLPDVISLNVRSITRTV